MKNSLWNWIWSLTLLTGCSTADLNWLGDAPVTIEHPLVHFVHPESGGKILKGRVALTGGGTSSIKLVNDADSTPATTDTSIRGSLTANGLLELTLLPGIDVYANNGIGAKVQIWGDTRINAKAGNFSTSLAYEQLIVDTTEETEDNTGDVKKASTDIEGSGFNTQLIFGYRTSDFITLYGGPFYTKTVVDNVHLYQTNLTNFTQEADVNSGHGYTYGADLGIFRENNGAIFKTFHFTFGGAIGFGKTKWKKTWPNEEEETAKNIWSGGGFVGFVW